MYCPRIDEAAIKEMEVNIDSELETISKLDMDLWESEADTKELFYKLQEVKENNREKIEKFEAEMKRLTKSIRENMDKEMEERREKMKTEKSYVERRLVQITERYSSYWDTIKTKIHRAMDSFTTERY